MRIISVSVITAAVADLCVRANLVLRKDVLLALKNAYLKESGRRTREILAAIIENAYIAQKEKIAVCQDTGIPCVFVELGEDARVAGDLKSAVNRGVELGYKKGFLRDSIIKDPLSRGRPGYRPAIIHIDIIKGDKLKITVLPKGFGCENKAQLRMFKPTADISEIKKFIIEAVKQAGPDACPPYVVGIGIGGTADYACLLAKKALLRRVSGYPDKRLSGTRKIEIDLLSAINKLNIGPMGLGGKTTALAVHIETYPTHIAGLPVAVNISCHALRSATKII
jgi:fumarate hydratase subunit alpha